MPLNFNNIKDLARLIFSKNKRKFRMRANDTAAQAEKYRRRKSKNRPRQERIVKRSDYANNNSKGRALFAPGKPEKFLGGSKSQLTESGQFTTNVFYMPDRTSSGEFEITAGSISLTLVKGTLNFKYRTNVKGSENITKKLQANESICFKKGDIVRFFNNVGIAEGFLVISSKFNNKEITAAVYGDTAVSQYHNTRNEVLGNEGPRKRRTPRDPAKVARLAAQIDAARGKTPSKNNPAPQQSKEAAYNTTPAAIIGSNPQPIGDLGEM